MLIVRGRVVGYSSASAIDWTARLSDASLSEESFPFDEESYEGSSSDNDDDDDAATSDSSGPSSSSPEDDVMCVIRLFALLPNYEQLPRQQQQQQSGQGHNNSLLTRYGAQGFDPCNPRHYRVVPYGWTVLDLVKYPLLQRAQRRQLPVYRGAPSDVVQYRLDRFVEERRHRRGCLLLSNCTTNVPTLEAVLASLERQSALTRLSAHTTVEVSVYDSCHAQRYRRVAPSSTTVQALHQQQQQPTIQSTFVGGVAFGNWDSGGGDGHRVPVNRLRRVMMK